MLNETTSHYNNEVDFFKKFLDPYMKYTSGLFESDSEDLVIATQRMLDTIIDLGNIRDGCRILEIGPGWGSLVRRIKEREIHCDYTGISPSTVQNAYIRSIFGKHTQLITNTFEQVQLQGKFDSIILMGSFCHLANKPMQLLKMREMLADKGVIAIEDTFFVSKNAYRHHHQQEATHFLQKKIFGFAEILALSEQVDQIADAGLKITQMLEHSNSYKATIRCWIDNLKQLDDQQYPKAKQFVKFMKIAQRGWGYTIQNQLLILQRLVQEAGA